MIVLAATLSSCLAWWTLDRRLVALDAPISLTSGQYQSVEFRLDQDFVYHIQIEVDGGYPVSEKLEVRDMGMRWDLVAASDEVGAIQKRESRGIWRQRFY